MTTPIEEALVRRILADLPENNELAFGIFIQKARALLNETDFDSEDRAREARGRVADFAIGLIHGLSLDIPVPTRPRITETNSFNNWFQTFWSDVNTFAVRYRAPHIIGSSADIITAISFSDDYRQEIGKLLNRVRKVINQADLPNNKKDAIYAKIAKLQAEVDRSVTRLGYFLSIWYDLTNAVGEGAENLEPAMKLLERVFRLGGYAKAEHDQGRLPAPEDRKQLPGPTTPDEEELDD